MNVISCDARSQCIFDFLFSNSARILARIRSIWPDFPICGTQHTHTHSMAFPLCVTARFTGYCSLFNNNYNFRLTYSNACTYKIRMLMFDSVRMLKLHAMELLQNHYACHLSEKSVTKSICKVNCWRRKKTVERREYFDFNS